jgi:hypothetical protein
MRYLADLAGELVNLLPFKTFPVAEADHKNQNYPKILLNVIG